MDGLWLASYVVLWLFVVFLAVLVLLLYRQVGILHVALEPGGVSRGLDLGVAAPELVLKGTGDQPVSLASLRGRFVLLVFGSPECKPCQELGSHLDSLVVRHHDQLTCLFVLIASPEQSRSFAVHYQIKVPVVAAGGADLLSEYQIPGTPFAYVLDTGGIIRSKGMVNNLEHLELLLGEAGFQSRDQVALAAHSGPAQAPKK